MKSLRHLCPEDDRGAISALPTLSDAANESVRGKSMRKNRMAMRTNQYSLDNPNGIINFGVAENSLMHKEIDHFLHNNLRLEETDYGYGDSYYGSLRMFTALASFFNRYFHPFEPVLPEHVVTGAGATAVIEQVCTMLCNPGDVILVAHPCYDGFSIDCTYRSGASLVTVDVSSFESPVSPSTLEAFERTIVSLNTSGRTVRVVLLCNPHNPLGICYPRDTLLAYMRFVEHHNLHLLVDEIYALSIFDNPAAHDPQPFVSTLSIDARGEAGCEPSRVHVLYGMSKDFYAAGLRAGALITQHHPDLRESFSTTGISMRMSSASDQLWSKLLNDKQTSAAFVETNQKRMGEAYARVLSFFKKHEIPHLEPNAGFVVLVDLRKYLCDIDDNGKRLPTPQAKDIDLWDAFLAYGVFISPGYKYGGEALYGWFRMTFTLRPDYLEVGLERFERLLLQRTGLRRGQSNL